jgi:hypothetical protein
MGRSDLELRHVQKLAMSAAPLQFLMMIFACWVNRRQLEIIEYLKEENRTPRELGSRRLRFTDEQRRRLAAKGRLLGGCLTNAPEW